jgi:hypothetical protein
MLRMLFVIRGSLRVESFDGEKKLESGGAPDVGGGGFNEGLSKQA